MAKRGQVDLDEVHEPIVNQHDGTVGCDVLNVHVGDARGASGRSIPDEYGRDGGVDGGDSHVERIASGIVVLTGCRS